MIGLMCFTFLLTPWVDQVVGSGRLGMDGLNIFVAQMNSLIFGWGLE